MSGAHADTGGLILAGGRSRRFGGEKAVVSFRGRTLLACAREALCACAAIAVSAPAQTAAAALARTAGLDLLDDDPSFPAGPLRGVAAGLAWAQRRGFTLLACAPCDAPLAGGAIFERLHAARGEAPAAYAETAQGGEPLFALWRVSLLEPLTAALRAGAHPPIHAFLDSQGALRVRFADARPFANANTPEELAALE